MSWMKGVAVVLIAGAVAFTATGAFAEGRPVQPLGNNDTELSLQEVLDSITVAPSPAGSIDAVNDQSSANVFTNTAAAGSTATFIVEITALNATTSFGIYDAFSPSTTVELFDGGNTNPDQSTVVFLADGTVQVNGLNLGIFTLGGDGQPVFGFYIEVTDNDDPSYKLYSDDDLNPGDKAQALIYQGDNTTKLGGFGFAPGTFEDDQWLIAFEDLIRDGSGDDRRFGASDNDFQDLIVLVDNLSAVPEPATLLLLGSGLAGAGFFSRKRLARKQS